jgi:type VI protein secretion system component VasK
MNRERIRGILGVWMPMVIGLWIIATAVIFYFTADLSPSGPFGQNLESWRLVCSAGVFFVGGLMLLSTFGRYQKARAVALEASRPKAALQEAPAADDDRPRIVK